ncbi:hypothetical protein CU024_2338 [Enterococcus faecium]|nr:hypothetical protein HMPREF1368_02635 [Enterococcus faecium ERV69]EJX95641.1 hypothetical protein HMPREF1366_00631 [Enterococcus faecium ERV26]EJX98684.1 hypothetical protein HMPREF1365_00055 [Enterococcus faecium ERV168]EJY49177.1 hypothetical protein HMPREF1347_01945 [Enterococcus faecium 504]MBK4758834.1 hypothetical protein [Enterococcus faecium]
MFFPPLSFAEIYLNKKLHSLHEIFFMLYFRRSLFWNTIYS